MLQFLYISWFFCFQILCIGNSREDRTNLQHASSTSGLWSPVAKGQTLQTLQTLQTRKSSPTLKTPTRKRQSIQLELSPSEQYTSTSGLWSPVAKGQTLQTRKSSPTLKTPTTKRQSIQLELSPSEQYTRVTKIWSPIDCISPQSKNQSLHLVWPPQDQYTFADDKAVTTSSNHSKWKVDCPRQTTCVIYMMIWQSNIELEIPICLKKKKVEKMLQKEISKTCHEENDRNKKCTSRWVRWYFNMFDKKCKFFLYGGCQSRNNNFKSKVECENTCKYKNPDLSFRVKYQNIFCPKCIKCRN
ncbi:uncharacterized protein [Mytilus edulis]|uniref:uncharacterized protein isoform X2 n=1 Tax=Mytilus edulis TaxID=6550 RepID=UPI0039EE38A4